MAARKSQPVRRQDKKSRGREDLVRRSPEVSDGAKLLWIELQRGWAWNDTSCNPSQEGIAYALGWTTRRVRRRLAELVGFKLLKIVKGENHQRNVYVLANDIPTSICDPRRIINKELRSLKEEEESLLKEHEVISGGSGYRTESSGDTGQNRPEAPDNSVRCYRTVVSYKDELLKDELKEDELLKMQAPRCQRSNTDHLIDSGDSNQKTPLDNSEGEDIVLDDASGLLAEVIAEPPKKKPKRKKPNTRQRRGVNKTLMGLDDPEPKSPGEQVGQVDYVEAAPPPVETAKDVLSLLYSEILKKYGEVLAEGVPDELGSKERGQVKTCLLTKYSPNVVAKMIRVLVWDWEVARTACWPTSAETIPSIKHLVQYRTALSSNIATGFDYTGSNRGHHRTYARQYLGEGRDTPEGDDPF